MERRKARSGLVPFCRHTMPAYKPGWHHDVVGNAIQRMIHGDLRRLMISMPPRHGKSELISRRLPAYLLGINPNETIITASYSSDLSSRMNRDVQRIMDEDAYKFLFPASRLSNRGTPGSWLRNSDIFEVVGSSGVYRSAGIGGGITGMGARWLIIDDPLKNREEADSVAVRENVWDWYTSTLYTRQAPDARILLVMTRWHSDDLAGRLIAQMEADPGADQWEVINFPAISENPVQLPDTRQPDEALWPELFPIDDLKRMKSSIGDYQWAALYQQQPRAGGGTEWPDSYFPSSIWFNEWPANINLRTIGVDPSKGAGGKHGDYSAIIKLGRDSSGILYCEADMERRSTEVIVDQIVEHQSTFRADSIAIEANQFQELLVVQVQQKAKEAGLGLPIQPILNYVNKEVRIRRLGPYLGQGLIRFKANSVATRLLVDQLKDFPVASHDDGPDALEMALRVMVELHNGKANRPVRRLTS